MKTAQYSYAVDQLMPWLNDPLARQINVPLAPGVYAKGSILGIISAANVVDVQTLTITGSPTGGTFSLYNLPGGKSITGIAYNVSTAALQALLVAQTGTGTYTVTGTAGTSYVLTAAGTLANQPLSPVVPVGAFTGGSTPAIANVHTTPGVGPNNTYAAYASGNSDGTQTPAGILEYPCTVNNDGSILVGNGTEIPGFSELVTPMYISGAFRCEDCPNIDANAITKLGGHLVVGNTTTGGFVF